MRTRAASGSWLGKRWRLGGALAGVQSPTYNRGRPRYREYNQFAVFGFYFSLPLAR